MAKHFFKRLLKSHKREPRKIVTDKLRSYVVAHRNLIPDSIHDTSLVSEQLIGVVISTNQSLRVGL